MSSVPELECWRAGRGRSSTVCPRRCPGAVAGPTCPQYCPFLMPSAQGLPHILHEAKRQSLLRGSRYAGQGDPEVVVASG